MHKTSHISLTGTLILSAVLACFFCWGAICLGQEKTPELQQLRRGRLLRTETRETKKTENFECQMLTQLGSFPILQIHRKTLLTHREVQVYEAVSETAAANRGEGITTRGTVDYVVVPGQIIEGEWTTKEEWIDNGPMAKTNFEFLGKTWQTDEAGQIVDTAQTLLKKFDDLRVKELPLTIKHENLGSKTITLTRNLLRRLEGDGSERDSSFDLLTSLGLDFIQYRLPSREGLILEFSAPQSASAGEVIKIHLIATNSGNQQVSSLLGRSFSRHAWLNGQMFYFGGLKANEKRSFIRLFMIPDDCLPGSYFISIGFWDVLGTVPGKTQEIKIEVK